MVEALAGAHKPHGAFLHEILERAAAPGIAGGERLDEPQVADDHLLLGGLVALLDAPREPGHLGAARDAAGHHATEARAGRVIRVGGSMPAWACRMSWASAGAGVSSRH